jgi:hypothetical protein
MIGAARTATAKRDGRRSFMAVVEVAIEDMTSSCSEEREVEAIPPVL